MITIIWTLICFIVIYCLYKHLFHKYQVRKHKQQTIEKFLKINSIYQSYWEELRQIESFLHLPKIIGNRIPIYVYHGWNEYK